MSSVVTDFDEVRFPEGISYGAVGGPKFKTSIIELASGYEKKNVDWSKVRGEWDVSYGLKTKTEFNAVRDFFMARRGRAIGFRFKDWADYKLTRQSIGLTNGVTTTFQIYKRYASDASYFDRDLNKIVTGSVTVWLDGVIISSPTINLNTGVITLTNTQRLTTGQSLEVQCDFDVPVRFDTDHLAVNVTEFNVFAWGGIVLKELRV